MTFQDYIDEKSEQGSFHSEGSFTLDPSKAAGKFARNALPSDSHYLLKLVQVANQLEVESIDMMLRPTVKIVEFVVPEGEQPIKDVHQVGKALSTPMASTDPVMDNLISALLGSLSSSHRSTELRIRQGQREQRLRLDSSRRAHISSNEGQASAKAAAVIGLSVSHRSSWKFWQTPPKLKAAVSLIQEQCAYSASEITLNGVVLESPPVSVLNEHLREIGGSSFSAIDGSFRLGQKRVAASNILFDLAESRDSGFSLSRPKSLAYLTQSKVLNLWAPGTRKDNELRPDGQEAPAWMLQFVRDGQGIGLAECPERGLFKAVLVMNIHGPGNHDNLRLKIVRHGVTVLELLDRDLGLRFDSFRGCTLVIANDDLETDLTGLQVVQNEKFLQTILGYESLLLEGQEYFAQGESMMTFV